MSEHEVIARLDRIESQLGKVLRILVQQHGEPPSRQAMIAEPPSQDEMDQWEREGEQERQQLLREIEEENDSP